ncbi:fructosamine kinase family protein [Mesorhizobium sp. M0243]|uniref:fructosamine kinase family protein n=1 Tax=Mesorhizobium sp. M0243 TaxID=2956925 RepID=UPI0033395952
MVKAIAPNSTANGLAIHRLYGILVLANVSRVACNNVLDFGGEASRSAERPKVLGSLSAPLRWHPEASGAWVDYRGDAVIKTALGFASRRVLEQTAWVQRQTPEVQSRFPKIRCLEWGPQSASAVLQNVYMEPLSDQIVQEACSAEVAAKIQSEIMEWVACVMHRTASPPWVSSLEHLLKQTEARLINIPPFYCSLLHHLIWSREVRINGTKCFGLLRCLELFSDGREAIDQHAPTHFCLVHGDLHTGNMLAGHEAFYLIDPRGSFGDAHDHFDICYDYGKILHDIYCGYSLIKAGFCRMHWEGLDCEYDLGSSAAVHAYRYLYFNLLDMGRENNEIFDPRLWPRAHVFAGLLMAGAIPYHLRFYDRVVGMAASAVVCLNRSMDMSEVRSTSYTELSTCY